MGGFLKQIIWFDAGETLALFSNTSNSYTFRSDYLLNYKMQKCGLTICSFYIWQFQKRVKLECLNACAIPFLCPPMGIKTSRKGYRACLANKKWSLNFCHSIFITHHSSLITHISSLIIHHSNFHIRLPSSSNFYHSIFFTLFMDPITVTVSDLFCFVTHIPFFPSVFLFFSFPLPLQPCLSPKAETQTQKNVSTSLASSIPSSQVNNAQVSDVYSGAISSSWPISQRRRRGSPNPLKFLSRLVKTITTHQWTTSNSPTCTRPKTSSVATHFPTAPTSNDTNITHLPILSRTSSSDPRRCFLLSLSSAQVFLRRGPFPF